MSARRTSISLALTLAASLAGACVETGAAKAVVVSGIDPLPAPANGWVGAWNGSSCIAVGTHWFISARHVGGVVGGYVYMKGAYYRVVEIVPHSMYDVELIRVAEDLPGFHRLAANPGLGDPCLLAGYGVTAAAALPSNAGYDWNGPRVETWGANMIEGDGSMLAVRFDPPTAPAAVPHESIFAVNDSGGALFTFAADGSLELAGVAVSVTSYGSAPWLAASFALNVNVFRNWAQPLVDSSMPISSAVAPPRAMLVIPGAPGWLGGALTLAVLVGVRRRKKSQSHGVTKSLSDSVTL